MIVNSTLSIVVITRNEEHNIQRTLTSCIALNPLEIIVVDSNSTDETRSIVQKNIGEHNFIKLHTYTTAPFTAARGRHIGAQHLSPECKHILFLDGDMEIVLGFLEASIKELSLAPDLAVVMGQMSNHYYDDKNNLIQVVPDIYDLSKHTIGGAMLIKRDAYEKSGGFNTEIIVNEESELEYRLNKIGYFSKRISTPMIRHHTEAPGSRKQFRSRLLNRRVTALGINLHYGLKDFGYLKMLMKVNKEVFSSLMFLVCFFCALSVGSFELAGFSFIAYLLYIKIKSGNTRLAINYCAYAAGMIVGFFLHLIKRRVV